MIRVLAVVLPFALVGCGLPPAVTLLSYALDGISLFSSGKTVGDHAISVAAKQDCAVWRLVKDEKMCREFEAGDKSTLVAAAEKWERGSEIIGIREPGAEPEIFAAVARSIEADPVVVPRYLEGLVSGLDGIIETDATVEGVPSAFAMRMDGPVGLAVRPAAKSAPVPDAEQPPPEKSWSPPAKFRAPSAAATNTQGPVGKIPAAPSRIVSKPPSGGLSVTAARVKPDHAKRLRSTEGGRVLVIGSFAKRANASDAVRKWRELSPLIVPTKLGRDVVFRVVTLPGGARKFASDLRRLRSGGVKDAWGAPVCGLKLPAKARDCIVLKAAKRN